MMRRTFAFALALALLAGCAPSQRRLLAGRHYHEALAGVRAGEIDGGAVLATIARDLELGLHVRAVPAEQLRAQLPGSPEGFDDLALVRIIHDSHALSLNSYEVSISLLRDGVEVAPVDTSKRALAQRASETLPEPEVIEHAGERDLRLVQKTRFPLAELLGRVAVNVVTVGLIHDAVPIVHDVGPKAYTEVNQPTAEDYARASPAAESMSRWLSSDYCHGTGLRCEQRVLWPREPEPMPPMPMPRFEVRVIVELGDGMTLSYRVPLPEGSLEAGLAQVFGSRDRRLDELADAQLGYVVAPDFEELELAPAARRELCEGVRGRRGRPGLRDQPDLGVVIEFIDVDESRARAEQLRAALVACGVDEAAIELEPGQVYDRPILRISHRIGA